MKKLVILLIIVCVCVSAAAEELPKGAVNLWQQKLPGCVIEAWYGWGDDNSGQLLAALELEGEFALAMAEKRAGEDWRLTLWAPDALRDSQEPDLSLDTDGDTLFFSYWEGERLIRYSASSACSPQGEWGSVSAVVYDGCEEWVVSPRDGYWHCEYYMNDEEGNILKEESYPPIPMDGAGMDGAKLEAFSADRMPLPPGGWQ